MLWRSQATYSAYPIKLPTGIENAKDIQVSIGNQNANYFSCMVMRFHDVKTEMISIASQEGSL